MQIRVTKSCLTIVCTRAHNSQTLTHTHTHTHIHTHLKAETVLLCLYSAPCLGIPGIAHRMYWHSCLIACSIVHSVSATPLSLFLSLSLSLSLFGALDLLFPLTFSFWAQQDNAYIKTGKDTHANTQIQINGYCTQRISARNMDCFTVATLWLVSWFFGCHLIMIPVPPSKKPAHIHCKCLYMEAYCCHAIKIKIDRFHVITWHCNIITLYFNIKPFHVIT